MTYTKSLFATCIASALLALAGCQPKTDTSAAPASAASSAEVAASVAGAAPVPASGADTAAAPQAETASEPAVAAKQGQGADGPVTHFKAYGFSPAWQAEIDGDVLEFDVPETVGVDEPLRKITVTRSAYAKGVNYDGQDGKVAVTLDIKTGPCDIATEGTPREFFAMLTYGKKTYRGCADAER